MSRITIPYSKPHRHLNLKSKISHYVLERPAVTPIFKEFSVYTWKRKEKRRPLVRIKSHINPALSLQSKDWKSFFNIILTLISFLINLIGSGLIAEILRYSLLRHTCHMLCPSHSPSSDLSKYKWRCLELMKLVIMGFSPVCCYLLLLTHFLSTLFSDTISLPVSFLLIWKTKFHTHSKRQLKLKEGNFKS